MGEAKEGPIVFQFPFILIKTKRGLLLMERLGRSRVVKPLGWVLLYVLPICAVVGFTLIVNALSIYLASSLARSVARAAGPLANILLPGVNPYLPFIYGWLALVVGIIVHEGAHGIVARSLGFKVRSSGLVLLFLLPIGAFVEVDEEGMRRARARDAGRVLAAGPGANIALALLALLGLHLLLGATTPIAGGIGISAVLEGYPAYEAGIMPGAVIAEVNGRPVSSLDDLVRELRGLGPGSPVALKVVSGGMEQEVFLTLSPAPDNQSRGVMGIFTVDANLVLEGYRSAGLRSPFLYLLLPTFPAGQQLVPFSARLYQFYTSPLGTEGFFVASNFLFWLWFINFNLAIFNALPIYPLDGGQALRSALRAVGGGRLSEGRVKALTAAVTLSVVLLIAAMVFIPYLI